MSKKPPIEVIVEEFTVDQFCGIKGVLPLDRFVAVKVFDPKVRLSLELWEAAFDEKGIPYKT